MRLGHANTRLTYCTNVHQAKSLADIRRVLETRVLAVRDRVSPARPFGVGLWLPGRVAYELNDPEALAAFQASLAANNLYVFTINGFPYGEFHGRHVKSDVYRPDWRESERARYTKKLADLLATLLPAEPGLSGSISTVPGAFKADVGGPDDIALIARNLMDVVAHLIDLKARTGKTIRLALEPEPCCFLETIAETVDFFRNRLFIEAAARLASRLGLGRAAAKEALRNHLGVCLDLCHAAVEFEDAAECVTTLKNNGIGIFKIQISAGLRIPEMDASALERLRRFEDGVYLHQVVERVDGALHRYADLDRAAAALEAGAKSAPAKREWRVHFHVPLFAKTVGALQSTQDFVEAVLARHRESPFCDHMEVETYTWDVMPESARSGDLTADIAMELMWARNRLET